MNRRTLLKLPLILLAPASVIAAPAEGDAVLAGDSHAYMLGPRLAREAKARGIHLYTVGRGGSSARQWLDKGWMRALLEKYSTPLVLISLGTNCVKPERKRLASDMARLSALADGRSVVWLYPPTKKFDVRYIFDAAMEAGVTIATANEPIQLEHDLVHATDRGLRAWADELARGLWPQKARTAHDYLEQRLRRLGLTSWRVSA